jgi:hypothetical protein
MAILADFIKIMNQKIFRMGKQFIFTGIIIAILIEIHYHGLVPVLEAMIRPIISSLLTLFLLLFPFSILHVPFLLFRKWN